MFMFEVGRYSKIRFILEEAETIRGTIMGHSCGDWEISDNFESGKKGNYAREVHLRLREPLK